MWGAALHDRSTGVHRPLTATALAIAPDPESASVDAGRCEQVLVAVDHCLLWQDDMAILQSAVCKAAGLPSEQVHVAFSHTHAAGLMDRGRRDLPGGELIAPYLDELAGRITDAIQEARHTMQPAQFVYGTGRCDLARNRDFWDAEAGRFVCGFNPGGPSDDTLLVARICDRSGRKLATIINYACHPTTLAWQNTLISPDYVGAMREVVEQVTGAPSLFVQGAAGDLGPQHGYTGDVAVADRNGRQLGYAALSVLESLPEQPVALEFAGAVDSGATLGVWRGRPLTAEEERRKRRFACRHLSVILPYRSDLPSMAQSEKEFARLQAVERAAFAHGDEAKAREARAGAERMARQLARLRALPPGDGLPVRVALWQLGDAYWVMVAGEYYHQLQRALRQRFAPAPVLVATVTDGWRPGYVPTRETYGRGIYQESIAVVAPGSLEQLIEAIGSEIAANCSQGS
jgi:hypothetical protein